MTYTASIVISTRNRREDLNRALVSAFRQVPTPEVIVIDDGSTDGTAAMVERDFSGARFVRYEEPAGYIVRRNQGARLARGEIVFSIDDDAEFSTSRVVSQTLDEFNSRIVGAVAIPYVNVKVERHARQRAPDAREIWLTHAYVGTAHAVRRELFLSLGGYREHLVHQGEEGDFCIRMLASGQVVRLGLADPVYHHQSVRRDYSRMDYYGARNAVLFVWQNVPHFAIGLRLATTTCQCLFWTLHPPRFFMRAKGILNAYSLLGKLHRVPVPAGTYGLFRRLGKLGPYPLTQEEWPERQLRKCALIG